MSGADRLNKGGPGCPAKGHRQRLRVPVGERFLRCINIYIRQLAHRASSHITGLAREAPTQLLLQGYVPRLDVSPMQVLWLAGETDIEWQIDDSIVQARRRYGRKPFRQTRRRSEAIGRLDSERHHDRIVVPQKFGGFKRVVRNAITRPDHERICGAPGYAYAR